MISKTINIFDPSFEINNIKPIKSYQILFKKRELSKYILNLIKDNSNISVDNIIRLTIKYKNLSYRYKTNIKIYFNRLENKKLIIKFIENNVIFYKIY